VVKFLAAILSHKAPKKNILFFIWWKGKKVLVLHPLSGISFEREDGKRARKRIEVH